jgi:hypothetical protein
MPTQDSAMSAIQRWRVMENKVMGALQMKTGALCSRCAGLVVTQVTKPFDGA